MEWGLTSAHRTEPCLCCLRKSRNKAFLSLRILLSKKAVIRLMCDGCLFYKTHAKNLWLFYKNTQTMWFYSDKSAPTLEAQPWHLRGVTMALRMRKHGTYLQYWKNIEKAKNKHRENKELFHFFLCFNLFLYLSSIKQKWISPQKVTKHWYN